MISFESFINEQISFESHVSVARWMTLFSVKRMGGSFSVAQIDRICSARDGARQSAGALEILAQAGNLILSRKCAAGKCWHCRSVDRVHLRIRDICLYCDCRERHRLQTRPPRHPSSPEGGTHPMS